MSLLGFWALMGFVLIKYSKKSITEWGKSSTHKYTNRLNKIY